MPDMITIVLISVLFFTVGIGIIVLILVYQKKQLQYNSEKEQLKANFEKEILESRLEIQEQTMRSIAQEVHDNIGQLLTIAKLNLTIINWNEPRHIVQEKVTSTSELLHNAIRDLRNLSKSLHSDVITEEGLIKAIQHEFNILKKTGVYAATLYIDGEPCHLPEKKELILFRIFQETINNIIKHSSASSVEIKINFRPEQLLLCIHDNGKGFNKEDIQLNKGIGLRNIMNRSQLIGASYNIESAPAAGTTVVIELPLPADSI